MGLKDDFVSRNKQLYDDLIEKKLGYIPDSYYGFAADSLSYRQIQMAIGFMEKTQPWLEANIGEFNKDWFVDIDNQENSFRLTFKDDETETYFKLSWMQMNHEDD